MRLNSTEMEAKELLFKLTVSAMLGEIPPLNLVRIIAANCGWNPLVIGESMTVGFGDGEEYTITRNADRFSKREGGE